MKQKKKMRILTSSILLLNIFSLSASASVDKSFNLQRKKLNFFAEFNYNSTSIETVTSTQTLESTSSITTAATEIGVDYFINPNFCVGAQGFFALMTSIESEVSGLSTGAKWYYINPGYKHEASIMGNIINSSPNWSPYVYAGYASRDFQFTNVNISFQGYELELGLDWHYNAENLIRAGLFYQSLSNTSKRSYKTIGLTVGYGFSF